MPRLGYRGRMLDSRRKRDEPEGHSSPCTHHSARSADGVRLPQVAGPGAGPAAEPLEVRGLDVAEARTRDAQQPREGLRAAAAGALVPVQALALARIPVTGAPVAPHVGSPRVVTPRPRARGG